LFFQSIPDTFSTLKPFIPPLTLGDTEKSHGYCLPPYGQAGYAFTQEADRVISKASSCVKAGYCASSSTAAIPAQTIGYGGCYCDKDCGVNGDCCLDAINCFFLDGTNEVTAQTYFDSDGDFCYSGLIDCQSNCVGAWAFNAIGDGICDDGRRTLDLNCVNTDIDQENNVGPLRYDYAYDGGDCYCPAGQYIGCTGTCVSSGPSTGCACSDIGTTFAISDCLGKCAPLIPTILCNGQDDFSVNCSSVLIYVKNSTTLEEAVGLVCKSVPNGCVVSIPAYIGDLVCDTGNYNTAVCNYDAGDCCQTSCFSSAVLTGGDITRCGSAGYTCVDPLYAGHKDHEENDGEVVQNDGQWLWQPNLVFLCIFFFITIYNVPFLIPLFFECE